MIIRPYNRARHPVMRRRAVGLSAAMSGSTGHGTCWSPPFKGARGDSETHKPPSISASIPNASPPVTH